MVIVLVRVGLRGVDLKGSGGSGCIGGWGGWCSGWDVSWVWVARVTPMIDWVVSCLGSEIKMYQNADMSEALEISL